MKAIILWGRANTGKTTTLNLVIQNLLSLGATVEHDCTGNRVVDRCLVVKYNGHRIAVCTDGDCESIVQRNFNDLKQVGATYDIFVGASRSRGASCNCIESQFSAPNDQILWYRISNVYGPNFSDPFLKTKIYPLAQKHQADCIVDLIHTI